MWGGGGSGIGAGGEKDGRGYGPLPQGCGDVLQSPTSGSQQQKPWAWGGSAASCAPNPQPPPPLFQRNNVGGLGRSIDASASASVSASVLFDGEGSKSSEFHGAFQHPPTNKQLQTRSAPPHRPHGLWSRATLNRPPHFCFQFILQWPNFRLSNFTTSKFCSKTVLMFRMACGPHIRPLLSGWLGGGLSGFPPILGKVRVKPPLPLSAL